MLFLDLCIGHRPLLFHLAHLQFGLNQSVLSCIDTHSKLTCFSEILWHSMGEILTSPISSAHSSISRYEYIHAYRHRQLCVLFFLSSIIRLSLFIPQSTVSRLYRLGLSFSFSHFAFQICLFTPRATLPHLKRYLSASKQFPTSIPDFFPLLPFPLRNRLIHFICCWCRLSLNSYFRVKTRSWPSNCHRVIPADPPIIQRNRFCSLAEKIRQSCRTTWLTPPPFSTVEPKKEIHRN